MKDHEFAHLLACTSAYLGLVVASVFAFVVVTTEGVTLETSLGMQDAQTAAVVLAQASPVSSSGAALTSDQLGSVVSLLQSYGVSASTIARVSADLGQVPDHTPPASAASSTPCGLTRFLEFGSSGSDVQELQNSLISLGFLGSGNNTGFFGSSTQAAVQHWQAQNGLVASGTPQTTGWGAFGPRSQQLLQRACPALSHGSAQSGNTPAGGSTSTPPQSSLNPNTQSLSCVLVANPSTIQPGQTVTLRWSSRNALSASMPDGTTNGPTSGTLTFTPTQTTTYQKTVYNASGQATCEATVTVGSTTPAVSVVQASASDPSQLMAGAAQALYLIDNTFSPPSLGDAAAVVLSAPYAYFTNSLTDYLYQAGVR